MKITHEGKKQKLMGDLEQFLADVERVSAEQRQRTSLPSAALRIDIDAFGDIGIMELSARGISILQNLATLDGEPELRRKDKGLEVERSSENENTSLNLWLKVRNVFSRWFG